MRGVKLVLTCALGALLAGAIASAAFADTVALAEDKTIAAGVHVEGVDLSCIKTGFGFSFGGQGSVKTFFLDDIEYVK